MQMILVAGGWVFSNERNEKRKCIFQLCKNKKIGNENGMKIRRRRCAVYVCENHMILPIDSIRLVLVNWTKRWEPFFLLLNWKFSIFLCIVTSCLCMCNYVYYLTVYVACCWWSCERFFFWKKLKENFF